MKLEFFVEPHESFQEFRMMLYHSKRETFKLEFYSINQRNIFGKRYLLTIEYVGQNMSLKSENRSEMFRRISFFVPFFSVKRQDVAICKCRWAFLMHHEYYEHHIFQGKCHKLLHTFFLQLMRTRFHSINFNI